MWYIIVILTVITLGVLFIEASELFRPPGVSVFDFKGYRDCGGRTISTNEVSSADTPEDSKQKIRNIAGEIISAIQWRQAFIISMVELLCLWLILSKKCSPWIIVPFMFIICFGGILLISAFNRRHLYVCYKNNIIDNLNNIPVETTPES